MLSSNPRKRPREDDEGGTEGSPRWHHEAQDVPTAAGLPPRLASAFLWAENDAESTPVELSAEEGKTRAFRLMSVVDPLSRHSVTDARLSGQQEGIRGLNLPLLQILSFEPGSCISDLRCLLKDNACLVMLDLCNSRVTQEGIRGIRTPKLQVLKLTQCDGIEGGITDLSVLLRRCPSLTHLYLGDCDVSQEGITGIHAPELCVLHICRCKGIVDITGLLRGGNDYVTDLNLSASGVNQAGIAGLEFHQLQRLNVSGCKGITDLREMLFRCGSTLTDLDVSGSGVTQDALRALCLPSLSKISVGGGGQTVTDLIQLLSFCAATLVSLSIGAGITQEAIQGVRLSRLKELYMEQNEDITDINTLLKGNTVISTLFLGSGITQDGIARLSFPLSLLDTLSVEGHGITDLSKMVRGSSVTSLSIGPGIKQKDLKKLLKDIPDLNAFETRKCPEIRNVTFLKGVLLSKLDLGSSGVTQTGLVGLEFPHLLELFIDGCKGITDLRALLRGNTYLCLLNICDSGVTQTGITGLHFPELEELYICECTGITDLRTMLRENRVLRTANVSDSGVTKESIAALDVRFDVFHWDC